MPSISELKNAVRRGDTEMVRELAEELTNDGVNIWPALKLAKDMNQIGKTRGKWEDVIEVLEEYA